MDRFFVPHLSEKDPIFLINDWEEVHHLSDVLRLKKGSRLEVVNGKGLLVIAEIASIAKKQVELRVIKRQLGSAPATPTLILACAMPKRVKFEDIIDKCTQLGVDEIIPMMTERTEVMVREKDMDIKCRRFEKVMIAAVKQSKRLRAPIIHRPCAFSDVLQRISLETFPVIPWLEGDRKALRDVLTVFGLKKEILFLIGPEGDFTNKEVELALSKGAVPASLGPYVLRVDTAAEFVVGTAQMLLRI